MKREMQAWISAVAGGCALANAGLWYWRSWDGGLSVPSLSGLDMLDFRQLLGMALLGLMFQFGTPALSALAWVLGLMARGYWAARVGMAMAGTALVMYAAYVYFWMRLLAGE